MLKGGLTTVDMQCDQSFWVLLYSSEILLQIINDILDISKIESGKLILEHIPINVQEIIDQVCELMTPAAEKKGLKLSCHFDKDVNPL